MPRSVSYLTSRGMIGVVKRLLVTVALLVVGALAMASPAGAQSDPRLTVMSQNLYLGTGLIPIATAPDRATFE